MTSPNAQALFERFLGLVGTNVEIALSNTAKPVRGRITNAMFDSVLVESGGKKFVIRFVDILYLTPA